VTLAAGKTSVALPRRVRCLLFASVLFLTWPVRSHGKEAGSLQYLLQEPWQIFFAAQDSLLARSIPSLLSTKLADLYRDLAMQPAQRYIIVIAPSRSYYQNYLVTGLPPWSGAYAVPAFRTLVVKSPRWDRPESDFNKSLLHVMVHLLLFERTGHQPLPRWLDEGLALFYEEPKDWDYPLTLSKALFTRSLLPLSSIEEVLSFQQSKASLAYQQSYSAVTYFLSTYDVDGLQVLLAGLRRKQPMDAIFQEATGSTFRQFEQEWRRYIEGTYRYYWLAEWDSLLWLGILALAIVSVIWIRRRNRRTLQGWEQASQEADAATSEDPQEPQPKSDESFIDKDNPDA